MGRRRFRVQAQRRSTRDRTRANAIKTARPDLQLHGFGLKSTALSSWIVRELLHTADSLAWSFAARKQGRNANDWREAKAWTDRINCCSEPIQRALFTAEELCTS
ncbi:deazapurine DNA modification protein DpdA family protein [Burkholderia sp. MSMB1072]|uniref:deazapurine DNA modification protein DpdA family protein n=1 Tax=Burkholderia sp. MSMB1072 TaxID=1637871 RepID=UPI003F8C37EA